jgi:hypothetical protein
LYIDSLVKNIWSLLNYPKKVPETHDVFGRS